MVGTLGRSKIDEDEPTATRCAEDNGLPLFVGDVGVQVVVVVVVHAIELIAVMRADVCVLETVGVVVCTAVWCTVSGSEVPVRESSLIACMESPKSLRLLPLFFGTGSKAPGRVINTTGKSGVSALSVTCSLITDRRSSGGGFVTV